MAQTGIYGPATFQRNVTLANLVLTLESAGPLVTVTKDKGQIVSSVTWNGGTSAWDVVFSNTYVDIDAQITLSASAGQNLVLELTAAAANGMSFKLFDLDVAGGGAGAAYVAGDVTAYISLALAA